VKVETHVHGAAAGPYPKPYEPVEIFLPCFSKLHVNICYVRNIVLIFIAVLIVLDYGEL
jgi:hypothetical protein